MTRDIDGRVIFAGAEFAGANLDFDLSNKCAIYDPISDSWTRFGGPSFFTNLMNTAPSFPNPIGEAACVILEDGTFMLADKASTQAALLDLKRLTWKETGTKSIAPHLNDEEGWTLLPNGKVLTVNCYIECSSHVPNPLPYPKNPTGSQIYNPKKGKWKESGSTINTLTDPLSFETGPAVLRHAKRYTPFLTSPIAFHLGSIS